MSLVRSVFFCLSVSRRREAAVGSTWWKCVEHTERTHATRVHARTMDSIRRDSDVVRKTPPLLIALPKQPMDVSPAPLEGASKTFQQTDGYLFSYEDNSYNNYNTTMMTGSSSSSSHQHAQEVSPSPLPIPSVPQPQTITTTSSSSNNNSNSEHAAAAASGGGGSGGCFRSSNNSGEYAATTTPLMMSSTGNNLSSPTTTRFRKRAEDRPSTLIGIGPESPTIITSPTGLLTISTGLSPARHACLVSCPSVSPGPGYYPLSTMYGQPPQLMAPMHAGLTTVPSAAASGIFAPPSSHTTNSSIFGYQEQPSKNPVSSTGLSTSQTAAAAAAVPPSTLQGLAGENRERQSILGQGGRGGRACGSLTGSSSSSGKDAAAAREIEMHDASVYGSNARTLLPPSSSLSSSNDAAQSELAKMLLCQSPVAASSSSSSRAHMATPPATQLLHRQQQQPRTPAKQLLQRQQATIPATNLVQQHQQKRRRAATGGLCKDTDTSDCDQGCLVDSGTSVGGARGPGPALVRASPWRGGGGEYAGGCCGTSDENDDSNGGSSRGRGGRSGDESGDDNSSSSSGEEEEEEGGCEGGYKGLLMASLATTTGAGELTLEFTAYYVQLRVSDV